MFKPIAQEIRDQIISRVKNNGEAILKLASEYNISVKTIYGWLRKQSEKQLRKEFVARTSLFYSLILRGILQEKEN